MRGSVPGTGEGSGEIETLDEQRAVFDLALDGDDDAISEILVLGYKTICAFVTSTGEVEVHECESVAHEAWIRFRRRWQTWRGEASLSRFARGFARNAIKDYRRKMARLRHREVLTDGTQDSHPDPRTGADTGAGQDSHVEDGELERLLKLVFGQLTQRQRDIFLASFNGEAQKDIGKRLGITRNTVAATLFQARKKLMQLLTENGYPR